MNRILVPHAAAIGERVLAGPAESHHLLGVQRVARGKSVRVSDGMGWQADAELVDVQDGCAVLEVRSLLVARTAPERIIVLGMPKAAALEEALVMGTEAGATRFWLVRAERSPPGELRADRLDRVLRAAMTQCGRADLPVIHGPVPLSAVNDLPTSRYVAAPGGANDAAPVGAAVLAVGPEGGWSERELTLLHGEGFVDLGLGPFIQRTPTAVAVGLGRLWASV